MITDHPLRTFSRQLELAAKLADDHATEQDSVSSHVLAEKIHDALSCALCELEFTSHRLPGDRQAMADNIYSAYCHREQGNDMRLKLTRGY